MNSNPCFCPSRTIHENDDDGDGGGDLHAQGVIVGGYCGEVGDAKDVSAAGFARGHDRVEDARFVARGVEIRSRN